MIEEVNTSNQNEVTLADSAAVSEPPPASIPVSDSVLEPQVLPQMSAQSEVQPEIETETQPAPEPVQEQLPQSMLPSSSHMKELWARFRKKVIERKGKKLEKIMALALKKKQIANDDVQKLLNISDATATRYLKELVRQGRLKQLGIKSATVYEPSQ